MATALTTIEARRIRQLRATGMGCKRIALAIGRSKQSVMNVLQGRQPHGPMPHRTAFYRKRAAHG